MLPEAEAEAERECPRMSIKSFKIVPSNRIAFKSILVSVQKSSRNRLLRKNDHTIQ